MSMQAVGETDPLRMKKYHEGYAQHQAEGKKSWTKYWMVLRGNVIFIFTSEDTQRSNMRGTLTLSPETELKTLPSKKKDFKFELVTISKDNERKVNKFKFEKDNDRDVWKSFIIGISVGIVPSDVHLLPGQLKDVHVAMDEVRNTPPPLPAINRSTLIPRPQVTGRRQSESNDSDDSGSFRSRFTTMQQPPANTPSSNSRYDYQDNTSPPPPPPPPANSTNARYNNYNQDDGGFNNLRDLMNRQNSLTDRILETPSSRGGHFGNSAGGHRDNYHHQPITVDPGFESSRSSYGWQESSTASNRRGSQPQNTARSPDRGSGWENESVATSSRFQPSIPDDRSVDTGFDEDQMTSNSMAHLFVMDHERNKEVPSWFFEPCSREEAENLLTCGRKFGNVLMRPSSTFHSTGKYVISMRREVSGGTNLNHYEVVKHSDGYKINVDNKHSSMRSLSEVMDFFVSVAGPGTKPMRTNDINRIFGSTMSSSKGSPPITTPSAVSRRTSQDGFSRNIRSQSPPSSWNNTAPSSGANAGADRKLRVAGMVGDGILQAVQEMNSDFDTHTSPSAGREYNRKQSQDDRWNNPTASRMNQTVPARSAPTETLQRQGGHVDDMSNDFGNMEFGGSPVPPPPPFVPPPPAPPPPPAAGGVPPPPRFNSQTMGGGSGSQYGGRQESGIYGQSQYDRQESYGVSPSQGFSTTPAPRRGLGPKPDTLEDQLKARLVSQREQIYADGAIVLKTNY